MDRLGQESRSGVRETSVRFRRGSREIPGVLWEPVDVTQGPLVLIGHGGSGSSREGYVTALARRLTREHGATCVAIDGPVHGDRRGERSQEATLVILDFSQAWATDPTMTDEMVADWRQVIDELEGLAPPGRAVGYWGLSMGTLLGLPLVAAEPRITACVLGLAGLTGPTTDRLEHDAPSVRCPTMFLLQWDDELFNRESSLLLFDALGAADKQLLATPGRHSAVPTESFLRSATFLVERLSRPAAAS